jgi:penicillin-binding protein 2
MNRRQFLGLLLALAGVGFINPSTAIIQKPSTFWWASLETGLLHRDQNNGPPVGLPGSVMKLITTTMILEEHLISPQYQLECRGSIVRHGKTYHCQVPHGRVTLQEALGYSCNVFFVHASDEIQPAKLVDYAREFGLNQSVSGFPSGLFPKTPRYSSPQYVLGLSPDLQPNLVQILRLTSLIATRGKLPSLHLSKNPPAESIPLQIKTFREGTWQFLQEGMHLAARHGTAKQLDPRNHLRLAVKTGTSPHGTTYQSWITGFFPYEDPKYVFCLRAFSGTSQDKAVPEARTQLFSRTWP